MRSRVLLSIVGLTLGLSGQPLSAQTAKETAAPAARMQSVRPAQIDASQLRLAPKLSENKRIELMNQARAKVQLPPIAKPPVSTTRVSAKAPVSPAGALINQARSQTYVGPTQSDPDGYFASSANGGGDYIKLSFPAENGKLYLLECKVRSDGNAPIQFSSEVGARVTETVAPTDDHVMVVVRATSSRLTRVLQSSARHWWWSTCDIAPAG
jgi:hypothetical protein